MNSELEGDPKVSRRVTALGGGVIVLLTFIVYWPALRGGFVWDDLLMVKKNPLITGQGSWHSIWFQVDFPLTTLALWLQYLLWGANPAGYHIVNVTLHAINALLVWRVLADLKIRGAWLAALIFAVHPVCVASAAWISELKNTLSLAFLLLSLHWYLGFEKSLGNTPSKSSADDLPGSGKRSQYYWMALGFFVLALWSKTSTVMMPVVLLFCAWWQRNRDGQTMTSMRHRLGNDLLRLAPFFVLSLVFGLATLWIQKNQIIAGATVQTENFFGRLAGAGMALWFYLGKALLPLELSMIYPRWRIEPSSVLTWLPLLLWILTLIACNRFAGPRGRPVLLALGCFTATLFPVLGFFDMYFLTFSRVSDHFQYLPMICVIALVSATLDSLLRGKALWLVATILVSGLCVLTFQRARVFATDENLWKDTLARNPAAWNAHNNLGCIRAEQGRLDDAQAHFSESVRLNPRNTKALVNQGKVFAAKRNYLGAESVFQSALKLVPHDADAHHQYGSMLAGQGRFDEAIAHLSEALRRRPEVEIRLELAGILRAAGKPQQAIEQCREVLRVKADHAEALANLAWLLATSPEDGLRNGSEAVQLAERACELTSFEDAQKVGVLAAAHAEAGQFDKAVSMAQKAVQLARAAGNHRFASMNEQLLQLYGTGRPFRERAR